LNAALYDLSIRADDLEFLNACQQWSQTILLGSMDGYRSRFEDTGAFFKDQLVEAKQLSTDMIRVITAKYLQQQA
jgi:prephenate dehydrogenase (NADP+)